MGEGEKGEAGEGQKKEKKEKGKRGIEVGKREKWKRIKGEK
jgi:hypothetical protein